MGLDEDPARLVPAARAAGNLLDLLEAALGGAKVAAGESEIGVHHADQGEVGKVIAFGHELRTDDDIDCAGVHRTDELCSPHRGPDRIRSDDCRSCFREQSGNLVGDSLDARVRRRRGCPPRRTPDRPWAAA